jgi:DNA/RNA endonuclease G (NUC1)
MADLFVSYTHVDRPRARPIVDLLESQGWTVWWDRGIEPGMPWQPALEGELAKCRAVMVLWSSTSVDSEWVRREARAGLEKGALVPILLDRDQIPPEFLAVQATDLSSWKGETHLDEVEALLRRLASLVPPSRIDTVRPGYEPEFLGEDRPVLLPGVTGAAAVLRYLHFTVVMSPARRLAHYVAYNIDGTCFVDIGRRPDVWSADPLLPETLQMNRQLLSQSPYDRGHLMQRSTGAWGDERSASISERQAFYWPNVAPQHQRFNRDWWLALEKWERQVAIDEGRLTGFSGPVFSEADEPFRGEVELEHGLVAYDTFRVPRAYWKVVAVAAAGRGKLAVASYLMDQVAMLAENVGRKIDLEKYRIPLADLEKAAHLRFQKSLHDAKVL